MNNSLQKTRKTNVSLWERVRFEVHKMINQQCEEANIANDYQDTDEVVDVFMQFALTLEVLSQACVSAAEEITDTDMHGIMIEHIKADKDFINSYKKCMGNNMARKYLVPMEKVKFMMKQGEA